VRIAHLAGQTTISTGVQRRRGYQSALAAAGVPFDPELLVDAGFTEDGGDRATEALLALKNPPTAVFAVTDMTAVGAYAAARRLGMRIPEDLAIAGYNDIPLAARLIPGLTTVHVPIHELGTVAAGMLLEQIETGVLAPKRVVFAPQLVVRGSTGGAAEEPPGGRYVAQSATE
jgi:LacI family transcriptional regulator